MQRKCDNCGNAKINFVEKRFDCMLSAEQRSKCCMENGSLWTEILIKADIDAEWVAIEVARIIYNQGKAKVFNVLESQVDNPIKLKASKRIVEDILTNISRDVGSFIESILDDWTHEVEFGGEVHDKDAAETAREYKEIQSVLGK